MNKIERISEMIIDPRSSANPVEPPLSIDIPGEHLDDLFDTYQARRVLSYDLQSRYNYWNSKVFEGKLPNIRLRWASLKNATGMVKGKLNRLTGKITVDYITISNTFARSDEKLDSVLLHEMCHAYVLEVLQKNDNHGMYFNNVRRMAITRSGIDITVKDVVIEDVSDDIDVPEYVVVMVDMGRQVRMQLIGKKYFNNGIWDRVSELYEKYDRYAVLTKDKRLFFKNTLQRKYSSTWTVINRLDMLGIIRGGKVMMKEDAEKQLVASTKNDSEGTDWYGSPMTKMPGQENAENREVGIPTGFMGCDFSDDEYTQNIISVLNEMGVQGFGKVAGSQDIRWQAVFMIGAAGSGKSRYRTNTYLKYTGFRVIDPDEVKKTHPEYDANQPCLIHEWSKDVSDSQFQAVVTDGTGNPIVVDGTGRDARGILKKVMLAKANGYRTFLVYTWVPLEVSLFRNRNRERFVPERKIMEVYGQIDSNFKQLRSAVDKFKVVVNFERSELTRAEKDLEVYPPPQRNRPPRPGQRDYGFSEQRMVAMITDCHKEAGIKEVVNKIVRRVRDSELVTRLTEKVTKYLHTKNPYDDLTSQEVNLIYRVDDYGDEFDTPKGELEVGWTNHSKYRSDLRGIDPSKVNEAVRDYVESHSGRREHKKVKLIKPGVGKAVVDIDTSREPERAHVVTVMASGKVMKPRVQVPFNTGTRVHKDDKQYDKRERQKMKQELKKRDWKEAKEILKIADTILDPFASERMAGLYRKFEHDVISKVNRLPASAPIAAQLLKGLKEVRDGIKNKMGLQGSAAVFEFWKVMSEGFTRDMQPMPYLYRKYGRTVVDRLLGQRTWDEDYE